MLASPNGGLGNPVARSSQGPKDETCQRRSQRRTRQNRFSFGFRVVGNGIHFCESAIQQKGRSPKDYHPKKRGRFPKVSQKWLNKPRVINHNPVRIQHGPQYHAAGDAGLELRPLDRRDLQAEKKQMRMR